MVRVRKLENNDKSYLIRIRRLRKKKRVRGLDWESEMVFVKLLL